MSSKWYSPHNREAAALLMLRLGLAWFLFVWAVNKILAPDQYVRIWGYFHGVDIAAEMPYYMGAGQIIVCAAMALGLARSVSYGLGFAVHAVTIWVILPSLAAPFVVDGGFPVNRNASVAVAALVGFAALWLLRHRDHWALDVWLAKRRAARS